MSSIPLTRFRGHLKQLAVSELPPAQCALFAVLFPRFYDRAEVQLEETEALKKIRELERVRILDPLTPRRFAGLPLPRGRYHAVSIDAEGDDGGTLTHELRAYRDPVRSGMVEVVDLGRGNILLVSGENTFSLDRAPDLGVVIHEPQRVAELLKRVPHEELRTKDKPPAVLVRFPYAIREVEIDGTLDLRLPAARAWFYEEFSHPSDSFVWPETFPMLSEADKPRSFASMYRWEEERAPVPATFEEMLPTLMSPVLGGGDGGWGGSTIIAIGHTLQNEEVGALIYPSSRSDALALVENGELTQFSGWCLVDYRRDKEPDTKFVTFDPSPWSWTEMPRGTTVRIGADRTAGSLYIEGIPHASAIDYVDQVESVRAAEAAIGPLTEHLMLREGWAIGVFALRWLLRVLVQAPADEIRQAIRVFRGLGLRNDIDRLTGEQRVIYEDAAADQDFQRAVEATVELANRIQLKFEKEKEFAAVIGAGIDLNLALMVLVRHSFAGMNTTEDPMHAPGLREITLPPDLRRQVNEYADEIEQPGRNVATYSTKTVALLNALSAYYAER